MATHYEVLGVATDASEADIVHAYRVLVRQWHPDLVGPVGVEKTSALNHAYDVLHDPAGRRAYDRSLSTNPPVSTQQGSPVAPTATREPPPERLLVVPRRVGLMVVAAILIVFVLAAVLVAWYAPTSRIAEAMQTLVYAPAIIGAMLLFFARRKRTVAWGVLGLLVPVMVLIGTRWPVFDQSLPADALPRVRLWAVSYAALAGIALKIMVTVIMRRRRVLAEARQWQRLWNRHVQTAGSEIFHVLAVEVSGGLSDTRLQPLPEGSAPVHRRLWGTCRQGSWVLVDTADGIIDEVPGQAPLAWLTSSRS